MEDLIYCKFNLFTLNQTIYIIQDNVPATMKSSTLENLATDILTASDKYSIDKIILEGNKEYGTNLAQEIYTFNKTKYNNKKIQVEVR